MTSSSGPSGMAASCSVHGAFKEFLSIQFTQLQAAVLAEHEKVLGQASQHHCHEPADIFGPAEERVPHVRPGTPDQLQNEVGQGVDSQGEVRGSDERAEVQEQMKSRNGQDASTDDSGVPNDDNSSEKAMYESEVARPSIVRVSEKIEICGSERQSVTTPCEVEAPNDDYVSEKPHYESETVRPSIVRVSETVEVCGSEAQSVTTSSETGNPHKNAAAAKQISVHVSDELGATHHVVLSPTNGRDFAHFLSDASSPEDGMQRDERRHITTESMRRVNWEMRSSFDEEEPPTSFAQWASGVMQSSRRSARSHSQRLGKDPKKFLSNHSNHSGQQQLSPFSHVTAGAANVRDSFFGQTPTNLSMQKKSLCAANAPGGYMLSYAPNFVDEPAFTSEGDQARCSQMSLARQSYPSCNASFISGRGAGGNLEFVAFQILPGWDVKKARIQADSALCSTQSWTCAVLSDGSTAPKRVSPLKRLVVQPKSRRRTVWDVTSMFLICFDAVLVPFAFLDIDENALFIFMSWFGRIFWTIDVFASCMTGYTKGDGELEMSPAEIIKNYARSWMAFDVILVIAEWLQNFLTEAARVGTRLARVGRLIRLTRISRILRLVNAISMLQENVNLSEQFTIMVNIALNIVAIMYWAHLLACTWYGVGLAAHSGWAHESGVKHDDLMVRYTMSLYWSTSVISGSPPHRGHLGPSNQPERLFGVFVIFFCFVLVASFLSSFTSSLTKFHIISSSTSSQISMLRMYMKQRNISSRLTHRVLRNATHLLIEQQRKIPEEEVRLLQFLSKNLMVELHFEERSGVILSHPLFNRISMGDMAAMKKICHEATSLLPLCKGDVLFQTGEIPPSSMMLFILHGSCNYFESATADAVFMSEMSKDDEDMADKGERQRYDKHDVPTGNWVGEPALWTTWIYRGLLKASRDGQVIYLEGEMLQKISPRLGFVNLREYAVAFVEHLNILKGECSELASSIDEGQLVSGGWKNKPRKSDRFSMHSLARILPQ